MCHLPLRSITSLRPLAPAQEISFDLRCTPSPGSTAEGTLRSTLVELLGDDGIRVVDVGTPGAAHVTIHLLRASVTTADRHCVSAATEPADDPVERAANALLPEIAATLA